VCCIMVFDSCNVILASFVMYCGRAAALQGYLSVNWTATSPVHLGVSLMYCNVSSVCNVCDVSWSCSCIPRVI
jgi:hypothetical protein